MDDNYFLLVLKGVGDDQLRRANARSISDGIVGGAWMKVLFIWDSCWRLRR